jgi:hypothetical protein
MEEAEEEMFSAFAILASMLATTLQLFSALLVFKPPFPLFLCVSRFLLPRRKSLQG